ncbi:MAG: hypothetical protein R3362_12485, partial [Rhodothermales bacterium]|nr:hypothetical protein [Rhodothermales bacterium]
MSAPRRFYRFLLRLHPEAVRRRHGREMERWFLRGLALRRRRGRFAAAAWVLRVAADAVASGSAERARMAGGAWAAGTGAELRAAARHLLRR